MNGIDQDFAVEGTARFSWGGGAPLLGTDLVAASRSSSAYCSLQRLKCLPQPTGLDFIEDEGQRRHTLDFTAGGDFFASRHECIHGGVTIFVGFEANVTPQFKTIFCKVPGRDEIQMTISTYCPAFVFDQRASFDALLASTDKLWSNFSCASFITMFVREVRLVCYGAI